MVTIMPGSAVENAPELEAFHTLCQCTMIVCKLQEGIVRSTVLGDRVHPPLTGTAKTVTLIGEIGSLIIVQGI